VGKQRSTGTPKRAWEHRRVWASAESAGRCGHVEEWLETAKTEFSWARQRAVVLPGVASSFVALRAWGWWHQCYTGQPDSRSEGSWSARVSPGQLTWVKGHKEGHTFFGKPHLLSH